MTVKEFFGRIIDMVSEKGSLRVDETPDFQCDQTGGFPTRLAVSWEHELAWLLPNDTMIEEADNADAIYQACADFGFKHCADFHDFNAILLSLGEDAYNVGYLTEQPEPDYRLGML